MPEPWNRLLSMLATAPDEARRTGSSAPAAPTLPSTMLIDRRPAIEFANGILAGTGMSRRRRGLRIDHPGGGTAALLAAGRLAPARGAGARSGNGPAAARGPGSQADPGRAGRPA